MQYGSLRLSLRVIPGFWNDEHGKKSATVHPSSFSSRFNSISCSYTTSFRRTRGPSSPQMTTTPFVYPALRALRLEIDGAVQECHGSYLADAQRLAHFCDKGARALECFEQKTASMVDPARGQTATGSGPEELQIILKKIILHIRRRSRTAIAANVMREAVLRQTVVYDTTTASSLEDQLREVVLLYYVDPVARDVEVSPLLPFGPIPLFL